jgi:hypothetical protein
MTSVRQKSGLGQPDHDEAGEDLFTRRGHHLPQPEPRRRPQGVDSRPSHVGVPVERELRRKQVSHDLLRQQGLAHHRHPPQLHQHQLANQGEHLRIFEWWGDARQNDNCS